jgi:hypothetical protein
MLALRYRIFLFSQVIVYYKVVRAWRGTNNDSGCIQVFLDMEVLHHWVYTLSHFQCDNFYTPTSSWACFGQICSAICSFVLFCNLCQLQQDPLVGCIFKMNASNSYNSQQLMVFKAARRDVASHSHSFESTRRRLGDHKARQGDTLPI